MTVTVVPTGDRILATRHTQLLTMEHAAQSPAQPHDGGPHPVPLPTPAWVGDPHHEIVPDPAVPVLRSVPGVGHNT